MKAMLKRVFGVAALFQNICNSNIDDKGVWGSCTGDVKQQPCRLLTLITRGHGGFVVKKCNRKHPCGLFWEKTVLRVAY